jgi:uncharacterized protein (DUF1800 family)
VVEALFKSDVFYSPRAYRAIVKSPVEFAVGAIKATNGQQRAAELTSAGGPPRLGGVFGTMGQTLFEPPNVAGWPGNDAWLNASTLFARVNFVNAITGGAPQQRQRPNAAPATAPAASSGAFETGTASQALAHFLPLALDDNIAPEARQVLLDYAGGPDAQLSTEQLRGLVYLVLGSPQFQLS